MPLWESRLYSFLLRIPYLSFISVTRINDKPEKKKRATEFILKLLSSASIHCL
jgi:hypothetical protein